jgi:hypothetical protein
MLSAEENDLLTRVEGDAPMGRIMRRHWIPVCLSEEVADADGTPVPARVLGEDLVVFRDSDGRLGVLDAHEQLRCAAVLMLALSRLGSRGIGARRKRHAGFHACAFRHSAITRRRRASGGSP